MTLIHSLSGLDIREDILECGVDYRESDEKLDIQDTFGFRTANLIMDGTVRNCFNE